MIGPGVISMVLGVAVVVGGDVAEAVGVDVVAVKGVGGGGDDDVGATILPEPGYPRNALRV